jgi:hypothetical protein
MAAPSDLLHSVMVLARLLVVVNSPHCNNRDIVGLNGALSMAHDLSQQCITDSVWRRHLRGNEYLF